MTNKSTRVGLSLSPDLIASLDSLCGVTGYSRAAVLHSLLVNTLPEMSNYAERFGWFPLDGDNCRYRGASAARLDSLIAELLLGIDHEEQLSLTYHGVRDE